MPAERVYLVTAAAVACTAFYLSLVWRSYRGRARDSSTDSAACHPHRFFFNIVRGKGAIKEVKISELVVVTGRGGNLSAYYDGTATGRTVGTVKRSGVV